MLKELPPPQVASSKALASAQKRNYYHLVFERAVKFDDSSGSLVSILAQLGEPKKPAATPSADSSGRHSHSPSLSPSPSISSSAGAPAHLPEIELSKMSRPASLNA